MNSNDNDERWDTMSKKKTRADFFVQEAEKEIAVKIQLINF